MPSPNATFTDIVTTTLRNRSKVLADNVTDNNALLMRLNKRGNVKTVSGGRTIVQELEYAENGTYKRYSGYETLDISPSDVFTAAEYDWKQAAVAVSISGLEQLQNSGPDAVIDLLESRIRNAERTMKNSISLDLYSDGTADSGKQIGGLQLLVDTTPATGTVGGIDAATASNAFWRNFAENGTTTITSTNVQARMNNAYANIVRGNDKPDLIIADNIMYNVFLGSLQTIQRITSEDMATSGFTAIKYQNSDVVLDGGIGGNCPTRTMYFLNTNYLFFRPHRDRNMVPIGDDRFSVNQDAMVKLIGFAGNMTVSNRSLQGVLVGAVGTV
jgi:hypothetical protein